MLADKIQFNHFRGLVLSAFTHKPQPYTKLMEVKIALFQKGLMATYKVERQDHSTFAIRLKEFTGSSQPPLYIKLHKTDRGWNSAFEDGELIREIGFAIDAKIA
jgi:hypothetical protein